jgi:hypothetical protein
MKLSRVPLADLPVDRITFSPGRVNDAYLGRLNREHPIHHYTKRLAVSP